MNTRTVDWAENVLWARSREAASGEIILSGDQVEVRVYLQDGLVAWATSSRARHAFSTYLVEHCHVPNELIVQAVADCRREIRPLGEWLVEKAGVSKDDVDAALRHQIEATFQDLRKLPGNGQAVFIARAKTAMTYKSTLFELKTLISPPDDNEHLPRGILQSESKTIQSATGPRLNLSRLSEIDGYIAMAVVDSSSGTLLGKHGNSPFSLELAVAGNAEVVRSKRKVLRTLGITDRIEDILISLREQYHIIRPFGSNDGIFLYMVLDRSKANLAMARHVMRTMEQTTIVQ